MTVTSTVSYRVERMQDNADGWAVFPAPFSLVRASPMPVLLKDMAVDAEAHETPRSSPPACLQAPRFAGPRYTSPTFGSC